MMHPSIPHPRPQPHEAPLTPLAPSPSRYGDDLDVDKSIKSMLTFIETQNYRWLHREQSRERKEDLAEVEDPRVDLILFCLSPHRCVGGGGGPHSRDQKVLYWRQDVIAEHHTPLPYV